MPKDCGALGKACCPSLYHQGTNPPQTKLPDLCASGSFCQNKVCVANKPDCGKFGKSCCVQTSGVATSTQCGPLQWDAPGPHGYCAYPKGKPTGDMRDQVCSTCPAKAVVSADPFKYFGCPNM